MFQVIRKLKVVKAKLKEVNVSHFSDIRGRLTLAREILFSVQRLLGSQLGDGEL